MPQRILRPWTDSEAVNSLDDAAEVFFVRLIQCADDHGRFYGSPQLLKAYLYPLKDKRIADISRLIDECVRAGLIAYYEVSGKRYIEIRNFGQRLRQKSPSRFPAPPNDGHMSDACQTHDGHVTDTCQTRDGHMSDACQTHDGHVTDTCQTRDGHVTDTCQTHDGLKREARSEKMECSEETSSHSSPKRSGGKSRRITFGYDDDNLIHGITQQDLDDWKKFYPALDVEQELRNASSWLKGNPKRRKSDILRFLTQWFQRAQDRAGRGVNAQPPPRGSGEGEWRV